MTGHPGERIHSSVALQTDDMRLYHRLVPLFERNGIPLLGIAPEDDVPSSVQVILNGPGDDPRSLPVLSNDEATLLAVLQQLDDRPTAQGGYGEVVFGVDPGRTIGLAVVADGQPLLVAESLSPAEAVDRIAQWIKGLDARSFRLHVGDGAPEVGAEVHVAASEHLKQAGFWFVPESSTTPKAATTGSRHADAAIHIALRRP